MKYSKGPEFTERRDAIRAQASAIYRGHKSGIPQEESEASIQILAHHVGENGGEITSADKEASFVAVAGRIIARRAALLDQIDETSNPVVRGAYRLEAALDSIVNRAYLGDELQPGGFVDQIRGITPAAPINPESGA
ncbi:hypothetical protein KDA11_03720 [Candidatus Saccharibacteria bacterium]|nr:hypothetical protein [Candidatus Saccharibacteria bacterium]